jgi:2-polyprenyl-3-methyl-5-hydroxy-6-metoxy-1,4-benzoquinol methylase
MTGSAEVSNEEVREIWDRKAAFWDGYMKEGNRHSKELVWPAQERLLGLSRGETVLEVACGNGNFARRMAKAGAKVVASDFSEVFIDLAKARTVEDADLIDYRVLDATDSGQLLALGEERFDAAVCTMALFDMSAIEPLVASLAKLLKRHGRFVFSIIHPCFESPKVAKVAETHESSRGGVLTTYSVKVTDYATPFVAKGTGVRGEPAAHWYFHRPLSMIFGACFEAGFVLDGIEEPVFRSSDRGNSPGSWSNYREIPPALVARMRLSDRSGSTGSCRR